MSNKSEHMDCSEESWNGFIPIRFTLCSLDMATVKPVHDVYVLASRYGYLNHSVETAIEYFRSFAIDIKSNVWFECNSIPLKSHLPIGVLYDLYYNIESPPSSSSPLQISFITSWNIIINFNRYPFDKLLKCETKEQCKDYYFHALKQSLHLIYGSTRTFTSISIENQQVLWNSACEGHYKNYTDICTLYNLIPSKETMRIIPIRLIIHTTTHTRSIQDHSSLPPPSLKSDANETAATTTDTVTDSSNVHSSANSDSTQNFTTARIVITHHTQSIQRPIHVYSEHMPISTPSSASLSSSSSILSTTVSSSSAMQIENQQQQDTHSNNTPTNENDVKPHMQLQVRGMTTLEQALQKLIPSHILQQHYDLNDKINQTKTSVITSTNEAIIDSSSSSSSSSSNIEGHRRSLESHVVIQGVNVPLSAPIYEIWCLLHHADLFLYITLNHTEIK